MVTTDFTEDTDFGRVGKKRQRTHKVSDLSINFFSEIS